MGSETKNSEILMSSAVDSTPSSAHSSFSVPSSPVLTRSQRSGRTAPPVTPQRPPRHQQQHSLSNFKSQLHHRSPPTPLTPYTPLSLRSFSSSYSNGSSTLTTPNSVKRLSFFSPDVEKTTNASLSKDKSLADIAENWRSRASENGIKVSSSVSACEDSHYGDDEASDRALSDAANDSGFITTEEALHLPSLPPHLRTMNRPRAQSQATFPTTRAPLSPQITRSHGRSHIQPTSPLFFRNPSTSRRTLSDVNNSTLNSTPPPNRASLQLLKLKGSFTDPPHTRRRESFGVVSATTSTPSRDCSGTLDLFDIDENDYEHEYENENDYEYENEYNYEPFPQYPQAFSASTFTPPFTSALTSSSPFGQSPLGDPFHNGPVLSSIAESVEHHFHSHHQQDLYSHGYHLQNQPQPQRVYSQSVYQDTAYNPKSIVSSPIANVNPKESKNPNACSVCSRSNPSTLAILSPCLHPLCSACLTSALNIVGEKDMECAVCKRGVEDFKLIGSTPSSNGAAVTPGDMAKEGGDKKGRTPLAGVDTNVPRTNGEDMMGKSFMDPLFSSPGSICSATTGLRSAFEFAGTFGDDVRASTPKRDGKRDGGGECVVLRIDNVPWDITPPSIAIWLQQAVERVHVLLDRKGKTMSHAFVEVRNEEVARAVLRGEGTGAGEQNSQGNEAGGGKVKEIGRGSVLGKGKRARGVTVTRSGQEELMRALFPAWRGTFDGSRPSLAGLDNDRVISALESGLMTEGEVVALLHLIRSPDSHFLKVPSLPFYSLISILRKFPADIDSRVFWSSGLRDILYDVTFAAVQILLPRVDQDEPTSPDPRSGDDGLDKSMELLSQLVSAAVEFQAFTGEQINKISELLDSCSLVYGQQDSSGSGSRMRSPPAAPLTPDHNSNLSQSPQQSPIISLPQADCEPELTSNNGEATVGPFRALAREFGVEAQLVQALAQRLSGMC